MFGEDAPELKPGEMYYIDNVGSISFTVGYERGTAVLFDRDKYCEYSHFGPTCSLGLLSVEGVVSQGCCYERMGHGRLRRTILCYYC